MSVVMSGERKSTGRSLTAAATVALVAVAAVLAGGVWAQEEKKVAGWKSEQGIYAVLDTSEGRIVCKLFDKMSPKTVDNFVGLAEGTKEFTDPVAGGKAKRPYFNGTKIHRIIPNFMLQAGDPTGTGRGGPGYTIPDEFHPELTFDRPGRLAMANAGPGTGGSQFFITQAATTWLNGKHTIFGQVVEGQEVVDRLCSTIGTKSGVPNKTVMLSKVTIERVGQAAPKAKKG